MSELIVVAFENTDDADRVLTQLGRLRREHLIDLEDAVIAIRDAEGEMRVKQSISMVGQNATLGGATGALWGAFIGLLFLNPLAGLAVGGAVGAGTGALSGSLIDYGINDDFIREIGETLRPDTSALFILVRKAQPEKVLAELRGYNGRILRSSLSPEQEAKLQAALSRPEVESHSHGADTQPAMA